MIRIRAALAAASVLLLAACGGGGGSKASDKGPASVKVSVIPIVDMAPIYLGNQQGFFAEQGLKLRIQTAQGGAAIVPAVVSGQVDFGFSNYTSLIIARSKGLPLKVVAPGNASTGVQGKDFGGVVVKAGSPIKTAKDLVGKRVAVNTLNTSSAWRWSRAGRTSPCPSTWPSSTESAPATRRRPSARRAPISSVSWRRSGPPRPSPGRARGKASAVRAGCASSTRTG